MSSVAEKANFAVEVAGRLVGERPRSGLQVELLEFLRRRAEMAKMVNRRGGWRQSACRKWFLVLDQFGVRSDSCG